MEQPLVQRGVNEDGSLGTLELDKLITLWVKCGYMNAAVLSLTLISGQLPKWD
jgi:hypothetical protein